MLTPFQVSLISTYPQITQISQISFFLQSPN